MCLDTWFLQQILGRQEVRTHEKEMFMKRC